jgi:hypothetical protein
LQRREEERMQQELVDEEVYTDEEFELFKKKEHAS